MKVVGINPEIWYANHVSMVLDIEPGSLEKSAGAERRFRCGKYASRQIRVAIDPYFADVEPIPGEWYQGLLKGEQDVDQWLKPVADEEGVYHVQ